MGVTVQRLKQAFHRRSGGVTLRPALLRKLNGPAKIRKLIGRLPAVKFVLTTAADEGAALDHELLVLVDRAAVVDAATGERKSLLAYSQSGDGGASEKKASSS